MYARPKNNVSSTISSISGNSLTVVSGDGAKFPDPPFYVTLFSASQNSPTDTSEIVLVIAKSGDNFTIVRAQQGTSQGSWVSGDKIWLTITLEHIKSLANVVLPTIDRTIEDDATNFESYSDEFDGSVLDTSWSWLNQGSASVTTKPDLSSIELYIPSSPSGDRTRGIIRDIPASGDWEVIIKILGSKNNPASNYWGMGLILYESSTGKAISFEYAYDNGFKLRIPRWNSIGEPNSFNSMVSTVGIDWRYLSMKYLKVRIDRSNSQYVFYYSYDGIYWLQIATEAFTNFFTSQADKHGIIITTAISTESHYLVTDYFRTINV